MLKRIVCCVIIGLFVIGIWYGIFINNDKNGLNNNISDYNFPNEKQPDSKIVQKNVTPYPKPMGTSIHDPIRIFGNNGFNLSNGVISGNGSNSNPYIISDWEINVNTAMGILIKNTNKYFIIRNCYIHITKSPLNCGIYFGNVYNGVIENNNISSNYQGIIITDSINNYVQKNNISNNSYGIKINNYSRQNYILNNDIITNSIGIYCEGIYNNFNNNSIIDSSVYGIRLESTPGHFPIRNLVLSNTIRFNNQGISLYNSSRNDISHNLIQNSTVNGIVIDFFSSYNNILFNNISSNSYDGITLSAYSKGNNIQNNDFYSNTKYAVETIDYNTLNNLVWKNNFTYNNGATNVYNVSHRQSKDVSGLNFWNMSGTTQRYGNFWYDWTSTDNNSDGIVDQPYVLSGNKDFYPIAKWSKIPEPSPAPLVMISVLLIVAIVVRIRKR